MPQLETIADDRFASLSWRMANFSVLAQLPRLHREATRSANGKIAWQEKNIESPGVARTKKHMLTQLGSHTIELAVVVPCFNERDNVALLVDKLGTALSGIEWEVIFVDDNSPDGTASAIRTLAAANRRVRCIQRIGRRGLSTAVIEGMLASSSPYLAVIDGDLQHDERLLPDMLSTLKAEKLDLVIGSRYVRGGGIGEWDRSRAAMSTLATRLARLIVHQPISDPMSGFFVITRPALERSVRRLSGQGFKIFWTYLRLRPNRTVSVSCPTRSETGCTERASSIVSLPGNTCCSSSIS